MSSTATKIKNPDINYLDKVLRALEMALDRREISDTDAVALMIEFSSCLSTAQLKQKIADLQELYPILKETEFLEQEEASEDFDATVQNLISYLIKNGRASEVASVTAATKLMNRSFEKLYEAYPELQNLI